MYELYQRVAPRPEDFGRLLDKVGESMSKDFDFTDEVRGLQVPTLIVCADADMAPPSHYVEIFKLLDGGLRDGGWMGEGRPQGGHALAVLPGLTHYNLGTSPLFAAVTLDFLDPGARADGGRRAIQAGTDRRRCRRFPTIPRSTRPSAPLTALRWRPNRQVHPSQRRTSG